MIKYNGTYISKDSVIRVVDEIPQGEVVGERGRDSINVIDVNLIKETGGVAHRFGWSEGHIRHRQDQWCRLNTDRPTGNDKCGLKFNLYA